LPHFENVTKIKADYPEVIVPEGQNGGIHERKAKRHRRIPFPLSECGPERNGAILNEIQFITGYNRKYALSILNQPQVPQALLVVKGKTVKLKPQKKTPANRTGKKIYTEEVIASLRLIWAFFWYKCGRKQSFRNSWRPLSAGKCPSSPPAPPHRSFLTKKAFTTPALSKLKAASLLFAERHVKP
jgi:hypothetical protein